jgi:molecular chaperone GrpE
MSDATPPTGSENLDSSQSPPVTEAQIEKTLSDFRNWLSELPGLSVLPSAPEKRVDLFALVEQFIALKQEVNLQTRAARSSLEQNADALKQLTELAERIKQQPATPPAPVVSGPSFEERVKPLFKAVIDAYDSLALALKQIDKQRTNFDAALSTLQEKITLPDLPPVSATLPTLVEAQGFWSRMFHRKQAEIPAHNPLIEERNALNAWRQQVQAQIADRQEAIEDATSFLDEALEGLLTGYEMSLSRIDKVLKQFDLVAIECEGEPFDAETMEAVEVIRGSDSPAGTVVEELRRGYLWRGVVFRFAQVKAAR